MPSNFSERVGSTLCSDHAVSAACLADHIFTRSVSKLSPGFIPVSDAETGGGDQRGVTALGKIVFVESEGLNLSVQSGS